MYEIVTGIVTVTGSEALTLTDPAVGPWSIELDDGPHAITNVGQSGADIVLVTDALPTDDALLDFVGGAYVIGSVSGLPLQPVAGFALEVT